MVREIGFGLTLAAAATVLCAAIYLYYSYSNDARMLKELALGLTATTPRLDDKVDLLSAFVYRNQGFAKNTRYFLLPSLGPTPVQVLRDGGDCSDKSRLLAAMLQQIGIDASLAMLYPLPGCVPVHTVVLAQTESGTMVADPVYDLTFPKPAGGYYDVREMTGNPEVLTNRLAVLRAARGPGDKIAFYDEKTHHYSFVTTVNWAKYPWLKAVSRSFGLLRMEPNLIRRPALAEDPKLLLTTSAAGIGLALAALALLFKTAGA